MNYMNFKAILNGNFDSLPVEKSKTVRIFLSSTLAGDFKHRYVFNLLKRICIFSTTTKI